MTAFGITIDKDLEIEFHNKLEIVLKYSLFLSNFYVSKMLAIIINSFFHILQCILFHFILFYSLYFILFYAFSYF